jgi:hypothetical protein
VSLYDEPSVEPDESFGPGTDLVISLLAILLLLLALAAIEQRQAPRQLWELREDYREKPLFGQNDAELTERARQQLRQELPAFLDALESDWCNQLLVEGYASPEAPPDLDRKERERWNLGLSARRSMAVSDYLNDLGIPYECMFISGYGRSHSAVLASWLNADPDRTVVIWDDQALEEQHGEQVLSPERIVRILGISHDSSLCSLSRPLHPKHGPYRQSPSRIKPAQ